MSSGKTTTTTKVRLVRCPKCRLVLPEMPNIPVYQCGGCFTTLQAKSHRQTITSLPETLVEEANNLDNVCEDKASSSSSQETTPQFAENAGMGQITQSVDINSIDNLRDENAVSENESTISDENGGDKNNDEGGSTNDEQVICVNSSIVEHDSDGPQHDSSTSNENCSPENGELLQATSAEVKTEAETDVKREIGSSYKRSKKEKIVDTTENCSIITTGESLSSDVGVSSPDEQPQQEPARHGLDRLRSTDTFYSSLNDQLEQHQETAVHGLDRLRSADTFHASSPNEQIHERTTLHGLDRLRSTETLYVSSNEQLEQPPPEVSHCAFDPSSELIDLSKSPTTRSSRAYYDDGASSHEGFDDQYRNKHGFKHAHRVANHADMRPFRRDRVPVGGNYSSSAEILAGPTHYASKYSMLGRDELLDSMRLGHPGRNWTSLERDEYLHHHHHHHRIPTELYYTSNFTSPDRDEKAKLLRMVSVLQDQLNKASFNDKANGRVNWKDHRIPMYYDHEGSFYNPADPMYSRSNWSQPRKCSHVPFSAEAAINRQWSAHLPPSRFNLCNSYGSLPSSPQRHVDPRFHSYSRRAQSDDQMHTDNGVRKYFREKSQLPKRHIRPLAGGAPFITCPNCLKQLQLPADFLLFRKKCHRLKCGACSQVLKFSLINYTNLIPYASGAEAEAEAPPPSEVDTVHRRRNFTSTSHVTDCPSVSCSDDCGLSSCKSCLRGKAVDRKMSSGMLEQEKERNRSKGKAPMVEYDSVGPSTSKIISSEIEELSEEDKRGRSSPLHRLMGYSSARQVLYG